MLTSLFPTTPTGASVGTGRTMTIQPLPLRTQPLPTPACESEEDPSSVLWATGSAADLLGWFRSQLGLDRPPESVSEWSDYMWRGRACELAAAVVGTLVYLRDHEHQPLTLDVFKDSLQLGVMEQLVQTERLPEVLKQPFQAYFDNLPGYRAGSDEAESPHSEIVRDHHGYTQMQFLRMTSAEEPSPPAPRLITVEDLPEFWIHASAQSRLSHDAVLDELEAARQEGAFEVDGPF